MARVLRRLTVFSGSPLRASAFILGATLVTTTAFGQAPKPGGVRPPATHRKAPPATLTPPSLKSDAGAVYPEQAIADKVTTSVEVVLVLELDASGAVQSAVVESPVGHGFDEAAVDAAKRLEFEPARRDGVPLAVKLRHKYTFTPPPARMMGRVMTALRDAPIAGATVTLKAADGATLTASTDESGEWRIEAVPFGTVAVSIEAPGFDAQAFQDTVDPGTEARIDARLERVASRAPLPPSPPPTAPRGSSVDLSDIEEVTVRGTRPPREVTKRTLEQRELARIPGTNGDALRAIQNLPGLARPPGLAGLLIVRGAAPQETGTYVDGTLVPLIYHFGGLSSVIPTEMLDHVDFYPGNFSAYFGRHSGGVIDVAVKDPSVAPRGASREGTSSDGKVPWTRRLHGLVQADLIDARALIQGPIGETGWTFAAGMRRSYVDSWLKPVLSATGSGVTTAPVYYDYQALVQRDWGGKRHSLRFFFFGADDRLDILVRQVNGSNPGVAGNVGLGTAFYRAQARYVGKLSEETEVRLVGAVGKDAIAFNLGDNYFLLSSFPVSGRFEWAQKLGTGVRNNFGLDMLVQPYTVDVRLPPAPQPGEPPAGPFGSRPPLTSSDTGTLYRPAVYDELELTPLRGTRIVPGVRLDYTRENRSWALQPRVVVKQDLTKEFPRTTVKGGLGRFSNPPQPQDTNPIFGVPGTRNIIANHYSVGLEQEITSQLEVSSEGFYRQYDDLIVQRRGNIGEGRAFGLETLVRYRPDGRFFGFLAYTLSRSVRKDGPDAPERLFNFDQTHILTAIGSYVLGRGWQVGARFRLISGDMRTPQTYGFFDNTVGAYLPSLEFPPFGTRNPMFHQLDLRVDKTWEFESGIRASAYLDLLNSYNQANVEGQSYNFNSTRSTPASSIPFLPSLGFRLEM
jgi:TonB family protein